MKTIRHKYENLGMIEETVGADNPKLAKLGKEVELKINPLQIENEYGRITR